MMALSAGYTLRRPAAETAAAAPDIAGLIAARGFMLALQPVLRIADRALDHAEALLRLPPPVALPPRAFVAAAAAAGLGPALDLAVLTAARAAPGRVSVNVCACSLQAPSFVPAVLAALDGAAAVGIELVRSEAIDDLATVAASVAALRAAGLRVALDAVDGGAASLALLQAARFDTLKLSGSVVRGAIAGGRGRSLLAELVRLAGALGAGTIATGIETLPQLWAAERAGVTLAQGWLLGAPAAWRADG
jgi:EAL domain-containing protein (putative c-di-GMP-specific phosphodiesterase class I)